MQIFTSQINNSLEKSIKHRVVTLGIIGLSVILYLVLGYTTKRADFYQFFGVFMVLFISAYWLAQNKAGFSFKTLLVVALILRLSLLFAMPELSNDFYRFIWDGELITNGVNPYAHVPNDLISFPDYYDDIKMRLLYHGMGELSQAHYSCYPPLNQLFFTLPALLSDSIYHQVIILKLILILADIGAIVVGRKILQHLQMDVNKIWLYALNPFIILEFSGNLHFEGVMIFFILLSLYFLLINQWLVSAFLLGCAIQIKLIPILILPFLFKKLRWKKSIGYLAMTALTVLVIGQLFLTPKFLQNMMLSVNEYFVKFEFNASIYYLAREIGFIVKGYNAIDFIGPILSLVAFISILILAIIRAYKVQQDLFVGILFAFLIYYAMATTIHPWYIALVLIFSIFTQYKFGLIWSLLVMLSYSAYQFPIFSENKLFLMTEHTVLFIVVVYEIKKYWRKNLIQINLKEFFSSDD